MFFMSYPHGAKTTYATLRQPHARIADPGAAPVRVLVPQRQDHFLRHPEDQSLLRLG